MRTNYKHLPTVAILGQFLALRIANSHQSETQFSLFSTPHAKFTAIVGPKFPPIQAYITTWHGNYQEKRGHNHEKFLLLSKVLTHLKNALFFRT